MFALRGVGLEARGGLLGPACVGDGASGGGAIGANFMQEFEPNMRACTAVASREPTLSAAGEETLGAGWPALLPHSPRAAFCPHAIVVRPHFSAM